MHSYIALLRAVNVGGTTKLPMADLKSLCEEAGFTKVKTYIASGNVVFQSKLAEVKVKAKLEAALKVYAGKPMEAIIRTAAEMEKVLADNPYVEHPGSKVVAIFLNEAPAKGSLENPKGQANEELQPGNREVYVYYPDGMGRSKLAIPGTKAGTARNMNTVAKLAEMAAAL